VPEGLAPSASEVAVEPLERSRELSALGGALAAVAGGPRGRLVLIGGEAGVGKTVLLRRFCDDCRGSARVLWGGCEALFTPRALGPLLDIAEVTGGELSELIESGALPHEVVAALMPSFEGGRRCSCSRTSTGPTRPRWMFCGSSLVGSRPSRRSFSPATATTSLTAAIR
jgi:AAA ATPase domain